jgi:hypothetical protein
MKKIWLSIFIVLLFTLSPVVPIVLAKSPSYAPYLGYEYNHYDESVAAPIGYLPFATYSSRDMGLEKAMDTPTDILYDGKNDIYILDGGNGRILELSTDFKVKKIYENFHTAEGESKSIVGAKGFTIDNQGNFYVANTKNNEVLLIDTSDVVLQTIGKPDSAMLNSNILFSATKVIVDHNNNLYVVVDSVNQGAFIFDKNGKFERFYGSSPIMKTSQILIDSIRKQFMTPEQRKGLKEVIPAMFSNFDMDKLGFLYTVSPLLGNTAQPDTVRRLNYIGQNILPADVIFGDLEWDRALYTDTMHTSFADVDIDADGFINLLDVGRGKVFQYTTDGDLVAEFGSYSAQAGGFSDPVAIETIGSKVYVLDDKKNSVICFTPSSYGSDLRAAFLSMNNSNTNQSMKAWTAVLKQNTNSQYSYYGIGLVYDARGQYAKAMQQFQLAGSHSEYSKAFREYRKDFVNKNYWLIILIVAAAIALIVIIRRIVKKRFAIAHGEAYSPIETKYGFPLYTALHPSDGFDQFKSREIPSYRLSLIFVLALFFLQTFKFFCTGYSFNMNRPIDYQFLITLFLSVGLFILFVVANWSVCTLLNGKGSLKEITAVCAYSLLPYLLSLFIGTLMSNILTVEESVFISMITIVGLLWSVFILVVGLQSIHQYSFGRTIGSILLTIIGMFIIAFLMVLFYTLLQQLINFIRSLMTEISLR